MHTAKSFFAECQKKTLGKDVFCRVYFIWHSANTVFAECPIKYTRQSLRHSAKCRFPVVVLLLYPGMASNPDLLRLETRISAVLVVLPPLCSWMLLLDVVPVSKSQCAQARHARDEVLHHAAPKCHRAPRQDELHYGAKRRRSWCISSW